MSLEEFIEAQQALDGLIKHFSNKYTEKFEKLNLFGKEFIADAGSFGALDDIDFDDRHLLFPEEFLKPGPGSPVPDLWVDDYKVVYDIDVRDVSQVLREDLRLLVTLVTEDVFIGDTDVLEKTIVKGFRIDIVDTQSANGTITGFGYTRTTDKPMLVIEMNPILGPEDNFLLQQGNFLANSYIEEFYPQNSSTRLAVLKGEIPLINTQEGNYEKKIDMLKFHTTENPSIGPKQKADMLKMLEISKNEELSFAADLPTPSQIDRATYLIDIEDTAEGVASDIVPDDVSNIDTPTNVVDDIKKIGTLAEKEDKVLELLDQLKEKYGKFLDDTASEAGDGSGLHFDLTGNNVISGDEIYIEALYIKPEHQGKGIGKEIVDELKKLSNEINVPITLVDFSKEGVEGVSFWEQLGFYDAADTGEGDGTIYRPDTPTNVVDDTPGGSLGAAKLNDQLVFDSWVDNLGRTTTSFVDNLPLETIVKNRVKNLITTKTKQLAKPGSLLVKSVDAWEFFVIGLMAAGVAFNEIDEVPKIINNTAINMFNSMTAPYGIAPVAKEEYDIDYEFINTVLDTGSKVMPTDIIIEKLKPYSLEEGEDVILPGTGVTATTGIDEEFAPYKESIIKEREETAKIKKDEVKQKILESKGVQEEKMFKQAKPKKSKPTGGAGAKIL